MAIGKNIIGNSPLPPFFEVANAAPAGLAAPQIRKGEAVRTSIRSLSGFQKEALVASARTGRTWRLVSDEGPYLDGHDAAPCPLAFFTTGMIAGHLNEITALADQRGVAMRKLRLVQDNFYTMKGSMLKRTMIGGAEPVELKVEIDCDLDDAALHSLIADSIAANPASGFVRGTLQSLFKLSSNGAGLSTGNAAELDAPLLPDPVDLFDATQAGPSGLSLLEKAGMTPKKQVALGTAAQGSSLSDEQNRRLNIGAIATMREDGLKEIRQMTYSPHGSCFVFLSEEAPQNGAEARAPDALSYLSAGIAFCFMTQFGRFVSMLKLDLPQYRVVQDTHFSLGGASGNTGQPGSADPVETHVYLQTSEEETTAREMLDISEQTCFLHALCRTDLKTRLKIVRL